MREREAERIKREAERSKDEAERSRERSKRNWVTVTTVGVSRV